MTFLNKECALEHVNELTCRIEKYKKRIANLEQVVYLTMKKPINEVDYSMVNTKWNNKVKSIKQRQKGIKRLNKNVYRFTKEIDKIKEYYLNE